MIRALLAGAAALAVGGVALADIPVTTAFEQETEPNNTFGTANDFGDPFDAQDAIVVLGGLVPEDVDYFALHLTAGNLYSASVFDFTPDDPFDNDSYLGIFRPDGSLFAFDDDGGPGFLSSIEFFADTTGSWRVAVTGFGDDDFNGSGHEENFRYFLVLAQVPAPGALALLGLAGLVRSRRRR